MRPACTIPYTLAQAICSIGVPSLDIGLAAARRGLVKTEDGEGTLHFEWDEKALNRLTVKSLEEMLKGLREAVERDFYE